MSENNIDYTPERLLTNIDYRLEYEWTEFSWNRYTENFEHPRTEENYDDIEFLCSCEIDDDNDIFFDLLCEEFDEIFLI